MIKITGNEHILLKNYLFNCCGIDIPPEKSYLFETRLNDLLKKQGYTTFGELHNHLKADKNDKLKKRLIEYMTTNETSFFRDNHPFQAFATTILPEIALKGKREAVFFPPQIKIWSAGCSTGQEPYSIAILVNEWLCKQNDISPQRIAITATDISEEVLEKAKKGVYSGNEIKKGMKQEFLEKYFRNNDNSWILNTKIRNMVVFNELNLAEDFKHKMQKIDIIFCRNVIIYFSIELKKKIIHQFYNLLKSNGILILGASETLYQLSDKFITQYIGPSIFYKAIK